MSRKSKSVRLKLYGQVYNEHMERIQKSTKKIEKEAVIPKNSYQLFMKKEGKKEKYRGIAPNERMSQIAQAWKKEKRKNLT
jgi:hypothetical protein